MLMVIKAVFFDFDGTVSDARGIALRSLSRTLEEFGFDVDERKIMEFLGVKMEKMLKMMGLKGFDVQAIRKRFYGYFTRAAVEGGIKPCCSLKPLWKMKDEDMPLIVISNSRTKFLWASIKTLEIEGLFKRVYGAEKFAEKDDMLRILFKRMKILPGEAVYVGDRFSDVEFARKAGCVAIAIHNKCAFSTLKRIEEEKPDYIVRDFYGLRRIINTINNSTGGSEK